MVSKRELIETLSLAKLRKLKKEKNLDFRLYDAWYFDEQDMLVDKLSSSPKVKLSDVKKYLTKANYEKYYGKKPASKKKVTKRVKRKRFSRPEEKAIYDKFNHKCAICGRYTQFGDGEIDHKKSLAKGGTHSPSNLQWLCSRCNKLKGSKRTNTQVRTMLGLSKSKRKKTSAKKKTTRQRKK